MRCQGTFKFKGLQKRDAGSFTNQNGQQINYKEGYQLKLDELTDKGVMERNFRLSSDNPLIAPLSKIELYQDIKLEFDVSFYNSRSSVVPIALIK